MLGLLGTLASLWSIVAPFGKVALKSALDLADKHVSEETERERIKAGIVEQHIKSRADVLMRGAYVIWFWFAIPLAAYWAKVIVWDTMLGLGTTPALKGMTLDWADLILGAIFLVPLGGSAIQKWKS